ncbi:Glutathione-binding protein GsiB precursor [compost metagenome]
MKTKKLVILLTLFLVVLVLSACGKTGDVRSGTEKTTVGEPVKGGTLKIAFSAEPETIDWMYTGATSTRDIGWHIFETLFTLDKNFAVKPMLVEDYTISEDRKNYTISLRKNVKFHDGSEMVAADAVASIERWRKISSVGKNASGAIEKVTAVDDHTVQIQLNKVYNVLLDDMSAPKSALMVIPASIAEAAGEQPLSSEQLIGTGPYKFDKWDKGQRVVLSRFDDYTVRDEEDWGGLTGKKDAFFDKLEFLMVKDPQVMLNGMKTKLYDYAQYIPADLYDVITTTPNIEPVSYMSGYATLTPDKSEPPFDDIKVRQALQYALDIKMIADGTYGNSDFYELDGALFSPAQTKLYTKEGTDTYQQYDPEKAKNLLKESSYSGQTLTLMYTSNNDIHKRASQIVKQQMEEVGFKVELVSYEWATFLEKWQEPSNWDLEVVGWSTRFSPTELGMLAQDSASSGWYNSNRWKSLLVEWGEATEQQERINILAKMNQTLYDELPLYKFANETNLDVRSSQLQNYDGWIGQRFWNVWKSE